MHIPYMRGSVVHAYLVSRQIEQVEDNNTRKGSRSQETTLGIDYHMVRKEVAKDLAEEIRSFKHNGVKIYYLTAIGQEHWKSLMRTGISPQTVKSWLRKYENFEETLLTNLKKQKE